MAGRISDRCSYVGVRDIMFGLFFTDPRRTLRVVSVADFASLCAFATVALLVSHLSNRIRQQAHELVAQRERQRALYKLSTSTLLLDWRESFGDHLCCLVQQSLDAEGAVIWNERTDQAWSSGSYEAYRDSLRAAFMAGKDYDLQRTGVAIRILRSGVRKTGVLWIKAYKIDSLTADSVATIVASSLERARALSNEVTAQSERLSEQLRTSVLDGLAHAFKTPLTTISVSSAGLAELPTLPLEQRAELIGLIRSEADRLTQITEQVLRTARLERNNVLTLRDVALVELIDISLAFLGKERERVHLDIEEAPVVEADSAVLKIAFEQVLENALKYCEPKDPVTIRVSIRDQKAIVAIHNSGSYVDPKERQLIFTRFYRSPTMTHRAAGTGIGLSVAHQAVEAHSGTIMVESSETEGTTFIITLPIVGDPNGQFHSHR